MSRTARPPVGEGSEARGEAPPRGIRLTFRYGADPKRAAEALVELLLSKRRHVPGEGAGDSPERRTS